MRLAFVLAAALAVLAPSARAQTQAPAPARSTLVSFRNDLPSSYRLQRVRLVVDGAVRYDGPNLVDAYLPPGGHVVEVDASYRLHNPVLSYVDHIGIQVRSAHVVHASSHRVEARAIHHGGATTPVERSAAIAWVDR